MASLVYEQLRTDILNGVLEPGSPLSQLAIANTRGTSRGPVREALRRLQQDQLVVARANQRFNVAPYDIADLEAVLSLHLTNVTFAIRVSVPFLTDADIQHLERSSTLMESNAGDEVRWDAAYRDFILTMVKHTGPRTESLIDHLIDNIERYRKNTLNKVQRVYNGGPEFREIYHAAAARDHDLASRRFAACMGRISMLILVGVAPQYNAARLRGYVLALGSYTTS